MAERTHSIRYNFLMNFILTAAQFVFPLISFPYVSRVLLSEGTGRVAFVSAVANYFLMIASLGIPTYGIRACAQVRDDRLSLSRTVQELFFINALMTCLSLLAFFLSLCLIPRFREESGLFFVYSFSILLNLFGMNWLFQALEKYDYITFRSLILGLLSLVLIFLFVRRRGDVLRYAVILVFSSSAANVLNLFLLPRYISLRPLGDYHFQRHFRPILILFSQSLVVSLYTNMDTVMLGFLRDSRELGLYNASVRLKGVLLSLVTSLGNVLLPRMSYYAKRERREEFLMLAGKAVNFTLFLSLPLALYFTAYAEESIRFLAGPDFSAAAPSMRCMAGAVTAIGLTAVLGVQVLTAEGRESRVLISVIAGAAADFLLNLLLIPGLGAFGAALATLVTEYLVLMVQLVFTRSYLPYLLRNFRGQRFLLSALLSLLPALLVKGLPLSLFFRLALSAFLYFGSYAILQLLLWEEFVLLALSALKRISHRKS